MAKGSMVWDSLSMSFRARESLSWEDSWGTLLSEPRERTKSAKWKVFKVYENHFICWYLLVVLSQIKKVEDLQKQQTVKRLDALYHVNSTRCTDSVLQSITRRVRLVALLSISFYLLWGCPRIHWGCFYWIIANYTESYLYDSYEYLFATIGICQWTNKASALS